MIGPAQYTLHKLILIRTAFFFFFHHPPLSCLGKHHPSSFPQSPPALPSNPHQHGSLLWHPTAEKTVSTLCCPLRISLSVLTRLFARTIILLQYSAFISKLTFSCKGTMICSAVATVNTVQKWTTNIICRKCTRLLLLQSGKRGSQQSEAFPWEEEEGFETTQSLPGPHHPQVCVFT